MAKPARSIAITCVSPFHPGAIRFSVFGKRRTVFPTEIVSNPKPDNAESRIFLISATRSHTPSARSRAAASAAAAQPPHPTRVSAPAPPPPPRPPRTPDRVPGPAPPPPLLPAAAHLRGHIQPLSQHQRANALRSAQLMRRNQSHLAAQPVERQGQLAKSLRQIRNRQTFWQVLHNPRFGIGQLHGAASRVCHCNPSQDVHRQRQIAPCGHSLMLHRRTVQAPPCTGQCRRFGRTGGKDDICAFGPQGRRKLGPRFLDQRFGRAPLGMNRGRIAHHIHCRNHRRPRFGPQRRGRVPVQIDPAAHSPSPLQKYPRGEAALPAKADGGQTAPRATSARSTASLIPRPPRGTAPAPQGKAASRCRLHPTGASGAGTHRPVPTSPPTAGWSDFAPASPKRRTMPPRRYAARPRFPRPPPSPRKYVSRPEPWPADTHPPARAPPRPDPHGAA